MREQSDVIIYRNGQFVRCIGAKVTITDPTSYYNSPHARRLKAFGDEFMMIDRSERNRDCRKQVDDLLVKYGYVALK